MIPKTATYYHVAQKADIGTILQQGLRLGIETGRSSNGIYKSDPRYVYLWISPRRAAYNASTHHVDDVFEVSLQADHPVERDYDQLLVQLQSLEGHAREGGGALSFFTEMTRRTIENILSKFGGVAFSGALTRENVISHVDLISKGLWDANFSAYRTGTAIPPSCLRLVDIGSLKALPVDPLMDPRLSDTIK